MLTYPPDTVSYKLLDNPWLQGFNAPPLNSRLKILSRMVSKTTIGCCAFTLLAVSAVGRLGKISRVGIQLCIFTPLAEGKHKD